MNIVIGADHAGFALKETIKNVDFKSILKFDIEFIDVGTYIAKPCDYPLYAKKVVKLLKTFIPWRKTAKQKTLGILICANGFSIAMVANRYKKIRASVCRNETEAITARSCDNANILCLGASYMNTYDVISTIVAFLETPYLDNRKHSRVIKQF